jgi:FkbM family methyltransferase
MIDNLTMYEYNGLKFLIHQGLSEQSEKDIISEVQREYAWSFKIETAIDVGAHIGAWTKYAKQQHRFAEIIAVEADPLNYALLQPNVSGLQGVYPWLGRVGYIDEPHKLVRNPLNTGSTYTQRVDSTARLDPQDIAPTRVRIEELMGLHRWNSLDVLKLDCEGAEVEILYEMPSDCLAKIGRIVGEIHTQPEEFMNVTNERLLKAGFQAVFTEHPGDKNLFYMYARRPS